MTTVQQPPLFSDVGRPMSYGVKQSPNDYVSITVAGASQFGSVTLRPQSYFILYSITCFTNYDNAAPVIATANSNAILPSPFAPNNFTVRIERGTYNKYSNLPIPQAQLAADSYRAGKIFPYPVAYAPRTNFQFNFQDTSNLFLLTATGGGTAVPMKIQMFLNGYDVPIKNWDRFCALFPEFSNVFAPSNQ